ncbi:energy-coupled thiamine transporter ThiT [Crassaminicella profunda]|uniref:energy-coupled thiamine transporter ThiT n=1 Tax=Crassaminicella profunda TaxID=1286698 RepID=UPI001CA701CA|nr:energy-coupled thiamine transporter ThiT [Crassaminicella profunda]QZY55936.1 energy-coupled thiamine transporter ThiT [Crassaminicella profunda]
MNFVIVLAVLFSVTIFIASMIKLKGVKLEAKSIARIGIVSAITIVLYMIKLVPFPQGGGCSLLSILPIMLLSILFGMEEGILCAIVVASIKIIIQPPYYPLQLPLDYYGAMMAVAFTPLFGVDTKSKIMKGAIVASLVSTFFSVFSGAIFFGQFAPEGMNPFLYSMMYNFLGYGVEASLSIVVLSLLPLNKLKKALVK